MAIDNDVLAAIINGSFNIGGGILSGIGQGQISAAQMAQQAELARANSAQSQFNQQMLQANQGLQSTQMDPTYKAKMEQQMAGRAAMMHSMVNGRFVLPQNDPATMRAYSPENQLASEENFYHNVANASPNSPTPDLSGLYGQAGKDAMGRVNTTQQSAQNRSKQEADAVNAALNAAGHGGDSGGGSGPGSRAAALALAFGPAVAKGVVPGLLPSAAKTTAAQANAYINGTTPAAGAAPPTPAAGMPPLFGGGGGGAGDPTQPGGTQGQNVGIGLPFASPYGGSGSAPTGASGQQGNPRGDEFPAFRYGGVVRGPAGIDQVPARLTAGEGVLVPQALAKLGGVKKLNQLNKGRK